jgi:hypothetical protein
MLGTVFTGTIFGGQRLIAGIANTLQSTFSADELRMLDELGETILPATAESGGAKAARVGEFMQEIVRDFYTAAERTTFTSGLETIQTTSRTTRSGRSFVDLNASERETFLLEFERAEPVPPFYVMLKQLTVWGYFSSEIGATQALAHVAVPGRYEGCVTVSAATRPWSE